MIPNAELCPLEVQDSFRRYIEDGTPTGDFLYAVLANDLKVAIGRADYHNLDVLPHIVSWLYNKAPVGSWGSYENVEAWLMLKRCERREKELDLSLLTDKKVLWNQLVTIIEQIGSKDVRARYVQVAVQKFGPVPNVLDEKVRALLS